MGLLEQSVQEVNRGEHMRGGAGLGNMLVHDATVEKVHVLVEWKVWSVVDGLAAICRS